MEYSTVGQHQDISAEGVIFDKGSVYDRLHKLTDMRRARGKRYSLVTVIMITLLAKLCGANTPIEIAEWGENHKGEIVKLLKLKRARVPEQSTYRRIMAYKIYMEEIERLVGAYNQQGQHGKIYAMDGKAMAQVEVGRKENEITKAPEALKLVEISPKVVTGDAIHTQKRVSTPIVDEQGDFVFPVKENQARLYQNIQELFAPEYPSLVLGKSRLIFSPPRK